MDLPFFTTFIFICQNSLLGLFYVKKCVPYYQELFTRHKSAVLKLSMIFCFTYFCAVELNRKSKTTILLGIKKKALKK